MLEAQTFIMYCYYAIAAFFGASMAWNAYKTKNAQDAVLYIIILIPFALRLMRLK